jgi:hypothetical protein
VEVQPNQLNPLRSVCRGGSPSKKVMPPRKEKSKDRGPHIS